MEDFGQETGLETEDSPQSGAKKPFWLWIIIGVVILAIAIPVVVVTRSRTDTPKVTLETLDVRLGAVNQTIFTWQTTLANHVSSIQSEVGGLASTSQAIDGKATTIVGDVSHIKGKVNSNEAKLNTLDGKVTALQEYVGAFNYTALNTILADIMLQLENLSAEVVDIKAILEAEAD